MSCVASAALEVCANSEMPMNHGCASLKRNSEKYPNLSWPLILKWILRAQPQSSCSATALRSRSRCTTHPPHSPAFFCDVARLPSQDGPLLPSPSGGCVARTIVVRCATVFSSRGTPRRGIVASHKGVQYFLWNGDFFHPLSPCPSRARVWYSDRKLLLF